MTWRTDTQRIIIITEADVHLFYSQTKEQLVGEVEPLGPPAPLDLRDLQDHKDPL